MNTGLRRVAVVGMASLCAASAGWGVLAGAPALATIGHGFSGSFGGEGSGAGQFSGPAGIAVNQSSGDVYVADTGNKRVEYFTASGSYIGQFNGAGAPTGPLSDPGALAVDNDPASPSYGDVYVADTNHGVIDKLSATGVYLGQLTGTCATPGTCPGATIPFGASQANYLQGLAVGPSGSLWVAARRDEEGILAKFTDTGSFVGEIAPGGQGTGALAVDSSENAYTLSYGEFVKYSSELTVLAESSAIRGGEINAFAIDPVTNDLYVGSGVAIVEYGPFGEPFASPVQTFGGAELGRDEGGGGIGVDAASGNVYAADSKADRVDIFVLGEGPEASAAEAPTDVQSSSATFHGQLSPGGMTGKLEYRFDYNLGTSCAGGLSAPFSIVEVAEGKQAQVQASVSGLQPNAQYTYCLVATNAYGTKQGTELSFDTPASTPSVTAEPAGELTQTSAALRGEVNPNNEETTYYFRYGTTTAYGNTSPAAPGTNIGAGFGNQQVSTPVSGLAPSTTYHYQLVAINATGEAQSSPDHTFSTVAAPPSATTEGASEVIYDAATVTGTVVPGSVGSASDTRWCFEYGIVGGAGYDLGSVPLVPGDAGQGVEAVPVNLRLTGLTPGGSYRYRLVAVNSLGLLEGGSEACGTTGGQETDGAEETFTTSLTPVPPTAISGSASGVSQNAATLSGTVDPNGTTTNYAFEIGIDTSYGVRVYGEAGSGSEPQGVSLSVGELQPGTTYHYRLVASSRGGSVYGADETFTTPVFPGAALTAPITEPLVAIPDFQFPAVPAEAATRSKKSNKTKKKPSRRRKPKGRRKKGVAKGKNAQAAGGGSIISGRAIISGRGKR